MRPKHPAGCDGAGCDRRRGIAGAGHGALRCHQRGQSLSSATGRELFRRHAVFRPAQSPDDELLRQPAAAVQRQQFRPQRGLHLGRRAGRQPGPIGRFGARCRRPTSRRGWSRVSTRHAAPHVITTISVSRMPRSATTAAIPPRCATSPTAAGTPARCTGSTPSRSRRRCGRHLWRAIRALRLSRRQRPVQPAHRTHVVTRRTLPDHAVASRRAVAPGAKNSSRPATMASGSRRSAPFRR